MIRFLSAILLITLFLGSALASMPSTPANHSFNITDPLSVLNARIQSLTPQTHHKKISSKDPEMLSEDELNKIKTASSYDIQQILDYWKKLDDSEIGEIVDGALSKCNEMFVKFNKYNLIPALQELINENLKHKSFKTELENIISSNIKVENSGMFHHDIGESCNNLRSYIYSAMLELCKKKTNGDINKTNTVTED